MTSTIACNSINRTERVFSTQRKRNKKQQSLNPVEIAKANKVALANDGLCHHVAHRFKWTGEEHEDLYQIAFIGLRKAALKYDGTCGKAFSSFAVPYCTGAIMHFLRDHGTGIKIPRRWRELRSAGKKTPTGVTPWDYLRIEESLWLCIEDAHAHQYHDSLEEQTTGELEADEVKAPTSTPEEVWAKIKVRIKHLPLIEYQIAKGLVCGVSAIELSEKLNLTASEFERRLEIVKLSLQT